MRSFWFFALAVAIVTAMVGCENVSKPYIVKVDRVDQEIPGNRGYLQGNPPSETAGVRQRELIALDIDLPTIKGKATKETKLISGGETVDILPPAPPEETK